MAYAGASAAILSNYDEVLKTFYLPAIQEQLNHDTILSNFIDTNEKDINGKNATIEMHYGRTTGIGARADGGALPDADYQKFKTATVPTKFNYGRVTFSGPTIAATRMEKGSYAMAVETEITGLVRDVKKDINRQMWGAGYGVLARWVSGATTAQVWQKSYTGNATGGDGFGSTFGGKYVDEINSAVAVVCTFSGSTCTVATVGGTNLAVSAIVEGTVSDTITCTNPAVSEAAGTYFIRPANGATVTAATSTAGEGRYEMMGIRGIVTDENIDNIMFYDGTDQGMSALPDPLQGLNVDTYAWFKARVDAHSGGRYSAQRTLTFDLMQTMFDKVEIKAGKDYGPDMILTTHALRREYVEQCRIDRRAVNTMALDGGFTAIDYNGVPFTVDVDAIDGEIYFLTLKDLNIYRMSDYDWMQKDGAILSRISGYDAYEATLFRYAELGCTRRNGQGVLCDLDYTAT